jgi:hypothetical protein
LLIGVSPKEKSFALQLSVPAAVDEGARYRGDVLVQWEEAGCMQLPLDLLILGICSSTLAGSFRKFSKPTCETFDVPFAIRGLFYSGDVARNWLFAA